ncbi:MAG: acyl-CoA-binding protein [Flavobacteriaceae bacterium]|nr:acyl-CoA-binding protein [Flavobacteriaceae bacterium]
MKNLDKLSENELEQIFKIAFEKVSKTSIQFKQDTLLYFYAYYKHANDQSSLKVIHQPENGEELVNAFKANALFQIRGLSSRDAKIKYIELAEKYLGNLISDEVNHIVLKRKA